MNIKVIFLSILIILFLSFLKKDLLSENYYFNDNKLILKIINDTLFSVEVVENSFNFPKYLFNFSDVKIVSFINSYFPDIPAGFRKMTNIESMSIISCDKINFEAFLDTIQCLPRLSNLTIVGNNFSKVPKEICYLKGIVDLDLTDNNINFLPDCILELPSLGEIKLKLNNITSFDNIQYKANKVWKMILSYNNLTEIPRGISKFDKLRQLNLEYNKITLEEICSKIDELPNLVYLNIQGIDKKKSDQLPFNISKLAKPNLILIISEVDYTENQIKKLVELGIKFKFYG